ncbi:MAG: hypothetical protein ACR2LL_09395 [Nitrosopumilus sp.]
MKNFSLRKQSSIPRETLFKISTDVSNFHVILPDYFKSLKIVEDDPFEKIVLENISFLGNNIRVKTKHVILPPDVHKIFILSGPLKGTIFNEKYALSKLGTDVTISVHLKLNRFLKFVPFVDVFLSKKMSKVMNEFLKSSDNYLKASLSD